MTHYSGNSFLNSLLVCTLLGLLAFAIYRPVVSYPFVHDDQVFIVQNPQIGQLDFKNIFLPSPKIKLHEFANVYYRPMLEFFLRLQYRFFGLEPAGYHAVNIFIHAINAMLVFFLVGKIVRHLSFPGKEDLPFMAGLFAGLLFLCHPVQTEAVAAIAGNSNTFCALLFFTAFLAYVQYSQSTNRIVKPVWFTISLCLYFMSLFIKEQFILFPFLIIAYEWIFARNTETFKQKLMPWAGFLMVMAGYLSLRRVLFHSAGESFNLNGELVLRILAIPQTLLMYIKILVFPSDLHYYRNIDILKPYWLPTIALGLLLAIVAWSLSRLSQAQKQLVLFGAAWFLLTLGPVLNIIPLINEFSLILAAEHFLYVPMVGFVIIILSLVYDSIESKNFKIFMALACLVFVAISIKQISYWRSETALFERTVKFEKSFGRGHLLLSKAYFQEGCYIDAIREGEVAIDIMQNYLSRLKDDRIQGFYKGFVKGVHFDIAHSYEALGRINDAIAHYRLALAIDPRDNVIYNNLGVLLIKTRAIDQAIPIFLKAIEVNRNDLMALNNLAICYMEKNEFDKAEPILMEILRKDNQFQAARENLIKLRQRKK